MGATDHRRGGPLTTAGPYDRLMSSGHLARVVEVETGKVLVGVTTGSGVAPFRDIDALSSLLELPAAEVESSLDNVLSEVELDRLRRLPPIDGATEVWAAGVTYEVSREARVEESSGREVYQRVYDAERPELFAKGAAWRIVTDGEPIAVRSDSANNTPEPEVGVVFNRFGEIVGFTVVDDVSSRSIEGENPLYLPQAKVYDGSCAIGPTIAPRHLIADERDLTISMSIRRHGNAVFEGSASTRQMKRSFDELGEYLFRQQRFPQGVILSTGTSVVPPLSTTLLVGDVVEIEVSGVGRLTCPVRDTGRIGDWLWDRAADPALTFPE